MPSPPHPCGPPSRKRRFRTLAGLLLLFALWLHPMPLLSLAAMAGLGASLWWVAQRQTSPSAALLALAFYIALPPASAASALGIFAMVYTATGVAHALQGPRRKWPPRIGLMTIAVLFTASQSPPACAAALVLSLPCAVWLAERRRAVLLLCYAFWAALAVAAAVLSSAMLHHPGLVASLRAEGGRLLPFSRSVPILAAFVAALAFYCAQPRSRFYGNTVPLLLALALAPLAEAWALPFALLFLAGVAADAFESRQRQVWILLFTALAALQIIPVLLPRLGIR